MTDTPAHLTGRGRDLWESATRDYDLSLGEQAALLEAAETLSTIEALERRLHADGEITASGRPSPILVELRQQRSVLVRLLGMVSLPLDGEEDSQAGRSRSARAAARSRWSR